jgi:hypothetical protein
MFNIKRAKVIHHVLLVLMVVSIGPLGFYGYQLIQFNREKLQTQERFSQIGIAQSLARLISLYLSNAREQVDGFMASSLDLSSGQELELEGNRGLDKKLEEFVGRSKNLLYINIVNNTGRGIEAGDHRVDDEMTKLYLAKAFQSASQNSYVSEPLTIEFGKETKPVIIMSSPIKSGGKGVGAVMVILKLDDLLHDRRMTLTELAERIDITRKQFIDRRLTEAGWRIIPERDFDASKPLRGTCHYCLSFQPSSSSSPPKRSEISTMTAASRITRECLGLAL